MPLITNIILATVTAYCPCTKCCGPNAAGLFANGQRAKVGGIAGPRNLPFGTRVSIGGRDYTITDRTNVRFDGRFDIFFQSHREAKKFGIKTNIPVTIIRKK